MSSFKFPPPPPPPPKAASSNQDTPRTRGGGTRGGSSRRIRGSGDDRGRGRGNFSRGSGPTQRAGYRTTHGSNEVDTHRTSWKQDGASRGRGGYRGKQYNSQTPTSQHFTSQQPLASQPRDSFGGIDPTAAAQAWLAIVAQGQAAVHSNQNNSSTRDLVQDTSFNRDGNSSHASSPPTSGIKRKRESQLISSNHKRERNVQPKVEPAPSVPNFGFNLPIPQPSQPLLAGPSPPEKARKGNQQRKHNQLGLTPRKEDREESIEDIDEEAAYKGSSGALQFEYNGKMSTLSSPADLAAWIAERKRNYPTRARVLAKKKEEEARRLATLRAMVKSSQESKKVANRNEASSLSRRDSKRQKAMEKYLAKAEKLRKELEESQLGRNGSFRSKLNLGSDYDSSDEAESDSDSSTTSTTDDSDSESGSHADSSDEPPEEESSKPPTEVTKREPPNPKPEGLSRGICTFIRQGKICPRGKKCLYRHDRPVPHTKGRVSLHTRLLEQQQKEDDRLALEAIKYLGRTGFFGAKSQ